MFPIFELSYIDLNGSDCIHSIVCRSKVGISLITTPRLSRRVKSNPVDATMGVSRGRILRVNQNTNPPSPTVIAPH